MAIGSTLMGWIRFSFCAHICPAVCVSCLQAAVFIYCLSFYRQQAHYAFITADGMKCEWGQGDGERQTENWMQSG